MRIVIALTMGAVLALTGCSASGGSASVASCRTRYEAWKHNPAELAQARKLTAGLNAVTFQAHAENFPATMTALRDSAAAARTLARTKPPGCADPQGYYPQFLSRIEAAGSKAGKVPGLTGIVLAVAPLKTIGAIQAKLNGELVRTVGKNS
jgi:hypothetical protein